MNYQTTVTIFVCKIIAIMVTLENLYAADVQKIVDCLTAHKEITNDPDMKSIYDRLIHDLHWIKIGKSKATQVPET